MLLGLISSASRNMSCSPVRSSSLMRSKSPMSLAARSSPLSTTARSSRSPMSIATTRSSRSAARSGLASSLRSALGKPDNSFNCSLQNNISNICLPDVITSNLDNLSLDCDTNDELVGAENEVEVSHLLGSGGFGSVYQARYRGRKVAVKKLHKSAKNPHAKLQSFRAELRALRLRHPNIVRTFGSTSNEDPDLALIVMEYAGDRNLLQMIDDPEQEMDISRRMRYALDIARALSYVHDAHVVHLDVKPANVLITSRDTCKLGDFGCCQEVEESGAVSPTQRSYLTGTFAYRAPECLKGEPPCTKADVYSAAITMWQMASRDIPYRGENQHVVIYVVVANGFRPRVSDVMERCARESPAESTYLDLVRESWRAQPDARPSSAQLRDRLLRTVTSL